MEMFNVLAFSFKILVRLARLSGRERVVIEDFLVPS